MKKMLVMLAMLLIINLSSYIAALFVAEKLMIIIYRMALLCNIGFFFPALSLICKEMKEGKE